MIYLYAKSLTKLDSGRLRIHVITPTHEINGLVLYGSLKGDMYILGSSESPHDIRSEPTKHEGLRSTFLICLQDYDVLSSNEKK